MGVLSLDICSVTGVLPPSNFCPVHNTGSQEITTDSPSHPSRELLLRLVAQAWHWLSHCWLYCTGISFLLLWIIFSCTSSFVLPHSRRGLQVLSQLCLHVPSRCTLPSHPHLPQGLSDFKATTHDGETHNKVKRCVLHLSVSFFKDPLTSGCSQRPASLHLA